MKWSCFSDDFRMSRPPSPHSFLRISRMEARSSSCHATTSPKCRGASLPSPSFPPFSPTHPLPRLYPAIKWSLPPSPTSPLSLPHLRWMLGPGGTIVAKGTDTAAGSDGYGSGGECIERCTDPGCWFPKAALPPLLTSPPLLLPGYPLLSSPLLPPSLSDFGMHLTSGSSVGLRVERFSGRFARQPEPAVASERCAR